MMLLRCKIDGLLLDAHRHPVRSSLVIHDGEESFALERVEALYYELVAACVEDELWLERAGYRFLRRSSDFRSITRRMPA